MNRKCFKCSEYKEATSENFHKAKLGKYGFSSICKNCSHLIYLKKGGLNRKRLVYYEDKKWCGSCNGYKLRTDFHKAGRWLKSKCKSCRSKENYNPNSNRNTPPQVRYENHLSYRRKWYKKSFEENPEVYRKYTIERRARVRGAEGKFTEDQWLSKLEFYGYRCVYCNKGLSLKDATKDHKIPLVKGGTNWIANIAPACHQCNSGKCDTSYTEYIPKYATQTI